MQVILKWSVFNDDSDLKCNQTALGQSLAASAIKGKRLYSLHIAVTLTETWSCQNISQTHMLPANMAAFSLALQANHRRLWEAESMCMIIIILFEWGFRLWNCDYILYTFLYFPLYSVIVINILVFTMENISYTFTFQTRREILKYVLW